MMQWIGVGVALAALVAVATAEVAAVSGYVSTDDNNYQIIVNYDAEMGMYNIPAQETVIGMLPVPSTIEGGYLTGILPPPAQPLFNTVPSGSGKTYIELQLRGLNQAELGRKTARKQLQQQDIIDVQLADMPLTKVDRLTGISVINVASGDPLSEYLYIAIGVPTPNNGVTRALIQITEDGVGLLPVVTDTESNRRAFAPVFDVLGYIPVSQHKPHFGFIPAEKPGQGYIHAKPIPGLNNIPITWPPAVKQTAREFIIVSTSPREYHIQVDTEDFSYIEVRTPFGLGFIQVHPTEEKAYIPLDNGDGAMRRGYIEMDLKSYTPIGNVSALVDEKEKNYPYHVGQYRLS